MNAEGATPKSLGFGAERHIQKSRSSRDANAKIEHLTCALEAVLLHLKYLEGDAPEARDSEARSSMNAEEAAHSVSEPFAPSSRSPAMASSE
jgi:hypothetical protein